MRIQFVDCANAALDYTLDNDSSTGSIDLVRLLPDAASLCEQLTGVD
jgi:hypothetical protein